MIISEEVYLEHFGVKGMRWGKRKSQTESDSKKGLSNKQKAAIGVVGAALLGAGILSVNHILKKHGAKKLSALNETEHLKRTMENGFAWKKGNGPWRYTVPDGAFPSHMNGSNKTSLAAKAIKKRKRSSAKEVFDIKKMNEHLADMYKEGVIWDKQNLGRARPKLTPKGFKG